LSRGVFALQGRTRGFVWWSKESSRLSEWSVRSAGLFVVLESNKNGKGKK